MATINRSLSVIASLYSLQMLLNSVQDSHLLIFFFHLASSPHLMFPAKLWCMIEHDTPGRSESGDQTSQS